MTRKFGLCGLQESSWSLAEVQHKRHEPFSSNWFCGLQILLLGFCLLLCYVESAVYHCLQYTAQYSVCQVLHPQTFWFVEDAKLNLLVVLVVVVSYTPLPHTQDDHSHYHNLGCNVVHGPCHSTGLAAQARQDFRIYSIWCIDVIPIHYSRSSAKSPAIKWQRLLSIWQPIAGNSF